MLTTTDLMCVFVFLAVASVFLLVIFRPSGDSRRGPLAAGPADAAVGPAGRRPGGRRGAGRPGPVARHLGGAPPGRPPPRPARRPGHARVVPGGRDQPGGGAAAGDRRAAPRPPD